MAETTLREFSKTNAECMVATLLDRKVKCSCGFEGQLGEMKIDPEIMTPLVKCPNCSRRAWEFK